MLKQKKTEYDPRACAKNPQLKLYSNISNWSENRLSEKTLSFYGNHVKYMKLFGPY